MLLGMVIAGGLAHAFGGRQQQNLSLLAHQIVHGGRTLAGERNLALSRAIGHFLRCARFPPPWSVDHPSTRRV
jgi:hypothetical protein